MAEDLTPSDPVSLWDELPPEERAKRIEEQEEYNKTRKITEKDFGLEPPRESLEGRGRK